MSTLATNPKLTTNQDLDPDRLREAFGFFPSGVVAVAAEIDGRPVGLAASSFTSVSLDPPLVSVNLAVASKTWPALRTAPRLGVTVLADHHAAVCRQLAGPVAARFAGVAYTVAAGGGITIDDGLARFDCTVHREVDAGDHVLILLELQAVDHVDRSSGQGPLVFHHSGFERLEPTVRT
ncbi:flavin reductase family protein [Nocardioides sp. CPCC 206347]|uniref:flavin reductase family protein n=1 Tax=Nocardioides sp. CPCC 206347 TaxID=3406463 RepID=UPI003B437AA6